MAGAFEDRLREAFVDLDGVDIDALRTAVRAVRPKTGFPLILDLVRLAYSRPVDVAAEQRVRAALNAKSSVIEDSGQVQLLRVLAMCCLLEIFMVDGRTSSPITIAALAVRVAETEGWQAVHPDVAPYAERWLQGQSQLVRRNTALPDMPEEPTDLGVGQSQGSPFASAAAVNDALGKFATYNESVATWISSLLDATSANLQVRQEQQDFAWWLLTSDTTEADGASLAVHTAASLDLATFYIPGPYATDQLFRRKLGADSEVRLARVDLNNAVASEDGWLRDLDVPSAHADFLPLLMNLQASRPCEGLLRTSVVTLARSLYDQLLLRRLIAHLENVQRG